MLDVVTTAIDPNIECLLQAAAEDVRIDFGALLILVMYGDRNIIYSHAEERYDPLTEQDHITFPRSACKKLSEYADGIFPLLELSMQRGITCVAGTNLLSAVHNHAHTFAEWFITDACEGGALEDFAQNWHSSWDSQPPKRRMRRLVSPSGIRKYVKGLNESHILRGCAQTISHRANSYAGGKAERGADATVIRNLLDICDGIDKRTNIHLRFQISTLYKRSSSARTRKERRERRKKLVRASTIATDIVGPDDVRTFIRGGQVRFIGESVAITVQRRANIEYCGHGALYVIVEDLNGAELSGLCIYYKDTPSLDQLVAIALAMRCGEERELLQEGNVTYFTDAGKVHPITRHLSIPTPRQPDARTIRNNNYWSQTKDIWISTLDTFVFGRNAV
jgi:hypothetical protein